MKYFKLKNGSLEGPDLKNLEIFYATVYHLKKILSLYQTSTQVMTCDDTSQTTAQGIYTTVAVFMFSEHS